MSKKKDRAWFTCPRWEQLVSQHYANDAEAARALKTNARVLAKLRAGTPVAKSTLVKVLRRYASRHPIGEAAGDLLSDTRARG